MMNRSIPQRLVLAAGPCIALLAAGSARAQFAELTSRLPIACVDDQMLDYGGTVAGHLQQASVAIRGGTIQSHAGGVAAVNQGVLETRFGRPFRRPMTRREAAAARRQVYGRAMGSAAGSVMECEAQIDAATARVRRAMVKRYQVEM
jgi:hypothetical protein